MIAVFLFAFIVAAVATPTYFFGKAYCCSCFLFSSSLTLKHLSCLLPFTDKVLVRSLGPDCGEHNTLCL